jgi:hypothetical protein
LSSGCAVGAIAGEIVSAAAAFCNFIFDKIYLNTPSI